MVATQAEELIHLDSVQFTVLGETHTQKNILCFSFSGLVLNH